jgi:hypothetical protein
MAATSSTRAGRWAVNLARLTRMIPSSSGWRSASSTVGENSASSSRKRTPPWARLTSPGRIASVPPPTRATMVAVWWGARNGGRVTMPLWRASPAAEWTRVASMATSRPRSGKRPGSRLASMVLPAPGGPTMRRWWPPADATSSARRTTGWPRTSARSSRAAGDGAGSGTGWSGHGSSPRRASTSSARVVTARTAGPSTSAASPADATGTTTVVHATASTSGTTPGTGRIVPSRPNSPTKPMAATSSGWSCSLATSTPTAMAKSRPLPILRVPEGARLTVMRRTGHWAPAAMTAARTRSRASRQAVSGRPTMVSPGRPTPTWTSTVTG